MPSPRGSLLPLLLVVGLAVLTGCGGLAMPDDSPRISIEFGMYPELFEGSEVLIDGKVVGRLEKTGQATRISFPVRKGRHEVRIKNDRFPCEPAHVTVELTGQKVRLLMDLQDRAGRDGSMRQVIVLQG